MTVGYSACEDCMALKEAVLVLYDNTDCKLIFREYRKANHQDFSLLWEHWHFEHKIDQPFLECLWLCVRQSHPAWIFQQCLSSIF